MKDLDSLLEKAKAAHQRKDAAPPSGPEWENRLKRSFRREAEASSRFERFSWSLTIATAVAASCLAVYFYNLAEDTLPLFPLATDEELL